MKTYITPEEFTENLAKNDLFAKENKEFYDRLLTRQNNITEEHMFHLFEHHIFKYSRSDVQSLCRYFLHSSDHFVYTQIKDKFIEKHWKEDLSVNTFIKTLYSDSFDEYEKRNILDKYSGLIKNEHLLAYLSQEVSKTYPLDLRNLPLTLKKQLNEIIQTPEFHNALLDNFSKNYYPSFDNDKKNLSQNLTSLFCHTNFNPCQPDDKGRTLTSILFDKIEKPKFWINYFSIFNKSKKEYDLTDELIVYLNNKNLKTLNHNSLNTLIKHTPCESFSRMIDCNCKDEPLAFLVCRSAVSRSYNLQSFEQPIMQMCRIIDKNAFTLFGQLYFRNVSEKVEANLVDFMRLKFKKDRYLFEKINNFFITLEKEMIHSDVIKTNENTHHSRNRI